MNLYRVVILALFCMILLTACSGQPAGSTPAETAVSQTAPASDSAPAEPAYHSLPKLESSSLYVKKVEGMPEDFILGMDVSSVLAEEASGVKYYDFEGKEEDLFKVLADSGVNTIRVRVWNDPYDAAGNGYGGGNCNIDTALEIGKRATKYGLSLLVDFHYSDFWADPSKQMVPKAWASMDIEEKTDACYRYTKECLLKLKEAGVRVGMVQPGNEINGALAGEKIWFNIQYLLQAGARATREVFPNALVALHFANPEKVTNYADYAKKLDYYQVDYDVFASSYYPYWHGSLENLAAVLNNVTATYGKKTMVMETSYAFTAEDTDFNGNTVSDGGAIVKNYPFTVQGQANCFRDVADCVANACTAGIGAVYWEGAWISVGTSSWEENSAKWEKYGSGWASSFAAAYDPKDAGKYYGGCAVDNQAFFDAAGHPLESLKVFSLLRYGNEVPLKADAIEDVNLICDLNGKLALPKTVNAVMNDDSRQAVPVVWSLSAAEEAAMYTGGPAKYTVTGQAGEREARCCVSMVEYNFLENYSFEDNADGAPWVLTDLGKCDELYIEDKAADSMTGTKHAHFWTSPGNETCFTLEQTVKDLPAGAYKYSISLMGGDAGETDIYAYVKLDGEIIRKTPMKITIYNEWNTGVIEDITYQEGQVLTVGIYVFCKGAGNGAWGKIDDALLGSMAK